MMQWLSKLSIVIHNRIKFIFLTTNTSLDILYMVLHSLLTTICSTKICFKIYILSCIASHIFHTNSQKTSKKKIIIHG